MGLDVAGRYPAGHGTAELDLEPDGVGGVLAQNGVASGRTTGDRGHNVVSSARSRTHVEAVRSGGQEAQLGRVPGYGQFCEVAICLDVATVHPADERGTETDLVPGGRGRILAQNVVAGCRAAGDRGHDQMASAGPGADVEAIRGGGPETQLRSGCVGRGLD